MSFDKRLGEFLAGREGYGSTSLQRMIFALATKTNQEIEALQIQLDLEWVIAAVKEGPLPSHLRFDRTWDNWGYPMEKGRFYPDASAIWPVGAVDAESVLEAFNIRMEEVTAGADIVAEEWEVDGDNEPYASSCYGEAINRLLMDRVHPHLKGGAYEPSLEEKTEDEDEELELSLTSHMVAKLKS